MLREGEVFYFVIRHDAFQKDKDKLAKILFMLHCNIDKNQCLSHQPLFLRQNTTPD